MQIPWASSDVIATFGYPTRVRDFFHDDDDKRNSCLDEFERSCYAQRSMRATNEINVRMLKWKKPEKRDLVHAHYTGAGFPECSKARVKRNASSLS